MNTLKNESLLIPFEYAEVDYDLVDVYIEDLSVGLNGVEDYTLDGAPIINYINGNSPDGYYLIHHDDVETLIKENSEKETIDRIDLADKLSDELDDLLFMDKDSSGRLYQLSPYQAQQRLLNALRHILGE